MIDLINNLEKNIDQITVKKLMQTVEVNNFSGFNRHRKIDFFGLFSLKNLYHQLQCTSQKDMIKMIKIKSMMSQSNFQIFKKAYIQRDTR